MGNLISTFRNKVTNMTLRFLKTTGLAYPTTQRHIPDVLSPLRNFFIARQPLVEQGLLISEASRSHSDTSYSVGILWTSDQPDAQTCTWQHTTPQGTAFYALGGTRNRNPSNRTTAEPRLRPLGHWIYPVRKYIIVRRLDTQRCILWSTIKWTISNWVRLDKWISTCKPVWQNW